MELGCCWPIGYKHFAPNGAEHHNYEMIPLEDNVGDIIGKAQRGLGISDSELAEKARVSPQTIRKLREQDFDESALLSVATILGLDGRALCELAQDEWHPKRIDEREYFAQFNTHYQDMTVNAYLVWDPAGRSAAAFGTLCPSPQTECETHSPHSCTP
jgi:hypothetical protein